MKRLGTAALSLALCASLAAPALAEGDLLIAPSPDAGDMGYGTAITLNGQKLDVTGIPAAAPDMLPLRLVAENDHGAASWFQEENQGAFYLDGAYITVNFADNSIQVDDKAEVGKAEVVDGVTFVPASVLDAVEGYEVVSEENAFTITTPNNAPLVKLAYNVMDAAGIYPGTKIKNEDLKDNYHIPVESFEELVAFFPMITSPDTVILGKLAKGADVDAVKKALEAYRQTQEDAFSWYLPQNLGKVKAAQTVVSGDYILFIIGEDAGKGVEVFNQFVEAQAK